MRIFALTAATSTILFLNGTNSFASQPDPKQFVGNYEVIDAACAGQGTQCSFSKVSISITDHFAGLTIKMDDTLTGIGESNCPVPIGTESSSMPNMICHQTDSAAGGIHIHSTASIEKIPSGDYKLEFSSSSSDWYDNQSFSKQLFTLKKVD